MTYVAIFFTLLIALVFPIVYFIRLLLDKKDFTPFLLGFATFFIFQILLRIPLLNYINKQYPLFSLNTFAYALFLGLGAGIFEEVGRYLMMQIGMKKKLTVHHAITFGIGHFACEAIILIGINYLYMLITNTIPQAPWYMFLVAGLERLMVLPVHVAMSIFVMNAIKLKNLQLLFTAILMHTFIDAGAVLFQSMGFSIFTIESFLAMCAVFCGLYIIALVKEEKIHEAH